MIPAFPALSADSEASLHEATLTQGLLRVALEALDGYKSEHSGEPAPRITHIICEAGLLSCFESETLKACLELFAENTPAEGAELIIRSAPLECRCASCGADFTLARRDFRCPECGAQDIAFNGGSGLTLLAINVEQQDESND